MLSELNQQTLDNIYSITTSRQQLLLKSTSDNKSINKEILLLSQLLSTIIKLKLLQNDK
jgi:hypothetical protein